MHQVVILGKMTERVNEASDMETALFLVSHIENPCTVRVNGEIKNIRDFYLRESRNLLNKLTNPFAKEFLKNKISEYSL